MPSRYKYSAGTGGSNATLITRWSKVLCFQPATTVGLAMPPERRARTYTLVTPLCSLTFTQLGVRCLLERTRYIPPPVFVRKTLSLVLTIAI